MKQMIRVAAMGIAGMMVLSAAAEDAYIETGTQAVNTGYHVTPTTRLVIDYMILDATNAQQRIFGVRGANNFCFENYINGSAVGNSHGISFSLTNGHWWAFNANGQSQYQTVVGDRITFSLDAATKRAALDFFDVKIRQTIDFLDKEFDGLSYSKADVKKGGFGKYIKDKTGLGVNVDKIRSDLHAESAIKDAALENDRIVNIDDVDDVADKTFEPIKQKVGELLKALVKQSVDLFIHTMESKHGEMYKSVTGIVSTEGESVEVTLSRLDNLSGTISRVDQYWQHKQNQPAQEDEGDVFEENHEEYLVE